MAKESFNWKSLFISDAENTPKQEPVKMPESNSNSVNFPDTKFPTPSAPMPTGARSVASSVNPYLEEVMKVYEKGFDGLNSEGFDFFELYKSVIAVGANNPQSYQMAFAMGKSLRPELTKQFVLEKAQFYIAEIEKVYQNYDVIGNSKQKEILGAINHKKETLNNEINNLKNEIARLQNELQAKTTELQNIDSENSGAYNEIQKKIEANNLAKQQLLESVNTVVAGVNQYL